MKKQQLLYVSLSIMLLLCSGIFSGCAKRKEVSAEEARELQDSYMASILEKTVRKPGPPVYQEGQHGGEYLVSITGDISSFNPAIIRDSQTQSAVGVFYPYLFNYNPYERRFTPDLAEKFRIENDEADEKTYVYVTLRENIFWTTANRSRVPIDADDIIFWFTEVEGEESLQLSGYSGQFITMEDGSKQRIEVEKLSSKVFRFVLPRILANPLLYVNMSFGPRYIFEEAKRKTGTQSMLDLLSIDTKPGDVPSAGPYYLVEYLPGQRIVLEQNPDYWERTESNASLPYIARRVIKIVSENTSLLMLKNAELSSRSIKNSELDEMLAVQDPGFTIYNAGTSLGSLFFSFNQNPDTVEEAKLRWFSSKKFRQAMSSAVPRQRIIDEIHRGLGEPALYFAAKANIFFDPAITLKYTFDLDRARSLLKEDGFTLQDKQLHDREGIPVIFDMVLGVETKTSIDMATLFAQELEKLGIKMTVRPIDFQNLVERVSVSYDWDAILVGLGSNYWPSSGSNVWPSTGNFHLWNPLQKEPTTDWEKRINYLYETGLYTLDEQERREKYREFQEIILEELPIIYLVYVNSFVAFDSSIENVFVDNLQGSRSIFHYFSGK